MIKWLLVTFALLFSAASVAAADGTVAEPLDQKTLRDVSLNEALKHPRLLSAFFGLDDGLPFGANLLCIGAWMQDGMPVVLSHKIDAKTLQPEDFRVVSRSGAKHVPDCVTLRPGDDSGELRTALLIGQFGNEPDDPPLVVHVVGDLYSQTKRALNFKGASVAVTPLDAGPFMVAAETVLMQRSSTQSRGTSCPVGTLQIVRVTWAGGVRRPDREEVGNAERVLYQVTIKSADGSKVAIAPVALADLGDNDNYHLLCLDTLDPAVAVSFPAGHLVDPNQDLNSASGFAIGPPQK